MQRLFRLLSLAIMLHAQWTTLDSHAQGLPLIRNFTVAEYGGHNRCYDIEVDEDGTVYVANFEGLLYYDRTRWRIIYAPDISRITVIYRDSRNTIWVGGYNYFARLQKRSNGELYLQQIGKQGRFAGEVMEIYEPDKQEGTIRFVASDNNIYELKGETITLKERTNINLSPGVESETISAEILKREDRIAILDSIIQVEELDGGLRARIKKNSGLTITDTRGHELFTITEENGLCSNQISHVDYDGHGLLWGATAHGIFAIELPSVYSYFLPKDGFNGEVHAITAFNGMTYVGGTNGVYCIARQQCKHLPEINNICWALDESREGLLAATSSGIYLIKKDGSVSRQTSNATTSLLVDGDKVYAGESDGVYCYQQGRVEKIDDLPLVLEIRRSANKKNATKQNGHEGLWLLNVHGESKGIDPGKPREPLEELPKHLYMPIRDIEVKAQYRQGEQVWIGGDEIIAIIDTGKKELDKLTDNRRVRFCSIILGNDSVLWGGYGETQVDGSATNKPKRLLKIGSNDHQLHFFYSLNYEPLSGKSLYRYRLDTKGLFGSEGQWSAWTEKQDIEFLSLPPGSFTLNVQAQLANGELSETASIDFNIAFPFLLRWYMVVFYLVVLAYMLNLLFRYRLKRLQKDKIKLERIVRERTSEVVKQKDEIVKQKDEIEEKSKSLEKALDELSTAQHELIRQEKMATVGKLTEGLIDRILNPMNYIINFSKMSNDLLKDLKENIDNNKDKIDENDYEDTLDVLAMLTENLQNVDQYGQNTTRTLKAMEEMLKDRTGGYVEMDLLPVLQQNEKMLHNYFAKEKEQYGIQMAFHLPNDPLPLYGNPEMLSKTVMSLLGNAVYAVIKRVQKEALDTQKDNYTPQVSLTLNVSSNGSSGKTYILKVHDNGIGIEEKILNKIFDPFFTTKTTGEAAGVGLYLSREIIQNHGGDISAQSVKDSFTEFTITLPVTTGPKSDNPSKQ